MHLLLVIYLNSLIDELNQLKSGEVGRLATLRMSEFSAKQTLSDQEIFKELCFCLLTANFTSERSMKIQSVIGDGFLNLEQDALAAELKKLGHRYPNARSKYIVAARPYKNTIKSTLSSFGSDSFAARAWLAEEILGLGYKESSHFLRNIGHSGLAIIDFHIIDILVRNKIIQKPKSNSLSKKLYLKIENSLRKISEAVNSSQGELDLYLWYMETGKILK